VSTEDVTDAAARIAGRWHAARERHGTVLIGQEGDANFEGLQRFLNCVRLVSEERRLSRYAYLARSD
jgi:hypothetical protein